MDDIRLEDLPIFCDCYYCCGEPVFRLGMLEQARMTAFQKCNLPQALSFSSCLCALVAI